MEALLLVLGWLALKCGGLIFNSIERVHGDKIDEVVKIAPQKFRHTTTRVLHSAHSLVMYLFFHAFHVVIMVIDFPLVAVLRMFPSLRNHSAIREVTKDTTFWQLFSSPRTLLYYEWITVTFVYSKTWWEDVQFVLSVGRFLDGVRTGLGFIDVDHLRNRIAVLESIEKHPPDLHTQS